MCSSEMHKRLLLDRDRLKKFVVQVDDASMDNNEKRRVTVSLNDVTVVRRPGEGSRPIFEREEIINRRRISETAEQTPGHGDTYRTARSENRERTDYFYSQFDSNFRSECETCGYDRVRDDLNLRYSRGRCQRHYTSSDYEEGCDENNYILRLSGSDEGLLGWSSYAPNETYYLYEYPCYYEFGELPSLDSFYYAYCLV